MIRKKITYVPALFKIFDEILVNAADNLTRCDTMSYIKVKLTDTEISVENNGKPIPISLHPEEKIYVPHMIFGHLLTGDNFDDDEKRCAGGRNGYGAKLTNIFSKYFKVEVRDVEVHRSYKMEWFDNMEDGKNKEDVKQRIDVKGLKPKVNDFVRVTFRPDLHRFKDLEGNLSTDTKLTQDHMDLFARRVWDIAGSTPSRCKVYLNDKELPVHSFEDYVRVIGHTGKIFP